MAYKYPVQAKSGGAVASMCSTCHVPLEAELIEVDGVIFLDRICPVHGESRITISNDADYFYRSQSIQEKLLNTDRRVSVVILELLDDCNLRCPTCVAGSFPGAGKVRSFAAISRQLAYIGTMKPLPSTLMLSGGEPTIHPDFEKIVEAACALPIKHVFVITNGVRAAESPALAHLLAKHRAKLEIYLQFDSLEKDSLIDIRGADLRNVREDAISNLASSKIPISLVCVVKRGVNDQEVPRLVAFAPKVPHLRGVTFQPLRFMGRTEHSTPEQHSITLSDVRRSIIDKVDFVHDEDLQPHPLSPATVCIGYFDKSRNLCGVTAEVLDGLYGNDASRVAYEEPLFLGPGLVINGLSCDDLFRIAVISYLDPFSYTESALNHSMMHFLTDGLELVPIDAHYLKMN